MHAREELVAVVEIGLVGVAAVSKNVAVAQGMLLLAVWV